MTTTAVAHALTRAATDSLLIELRHPEPGGRGGPAAREQGICGTCLVPVLSQAERMANDRMTICCSRARTAELTLDV